MNVDHSFSMNDICTPFTIIYSQKSRWQTAICPNKKSYSFSRHTDWITFWKKAFSELFEFVAVLADRTEFTSSTLSSTALIKTLWNKTVKIVFCLVCTKSFQERVEKYCSCGNRLDAKNLRKAAIKLCLLH